MKLTDSTEKLTNKEEVDDPTQDIVFIELFQDPRDPTERLVQPRNEGSDLSFID
jgi:hypothetical protein